MDGQVRPERPRVKFCQSIAPVRLFLDDIEQIAAYLFELSSEADLALVTPRREVTSVEGLTSLGRQEVSALEIRCSANPRRIDDFVVSIGPESVFLCRTGDTLAHRRVFSQIEALLLARRRGWQWRNRLLEAAGFLGPLSAAVLLLAQSYLQSRLPYVGVVLGGLSLSLLAAYLATRRWSKSSVVLIKRQEHRVHWEYMSGALMIVALILLMVLLTLGLAFLSQLLERSAT